MPNKPDPKNNDLVPRSMLPEQNATEQKWVLSKKAKAPKAPAGVQSRNYHKKVK